MIFELLPVLKGWTYVAKDCDSPFVLKAGKEHIIDESDTPGWQIMLLCTVSDPDTLISAIAYDPYSVPIEMGTTPRTLKEVGIIAPSSGFWLAKYDTDNNIYTICYTPYRIIPFTRGKMYIRAPRDRDVIVRGYASATARIYDMKLFLSSLKEVL